MEQTKTNVFFQIIGFLLAAALIFVCYTMVNRVIDALIGEKGGVIAGIMIAAMTGLGSVLVVIGSKHYERKQSHENELRQKKLPIYEDIINFIFEVALSDKLGKKSPTEADMVAFLAKSVKELTIWGADDVVKAFRNFRKASTQNKNVLFAIERVMFEIRKDLGHKNRNLRDGELLDLFLNDVDTLRK